MSSLGRGFSPKHKEELSTAAAQSRLWGFWGSLASTSSSQASALERSLPFHQPLPSSHLPVLATVINRPSFGPASLIRCLGAASTDGCFFWLGKSHALC